MTEQEYVHAKALGSVSSALATLITLIPANLEGIITDKEWSQSIQVLSKWQDRLFAAIEIDSEDEKKDLT